MVPSDAAIRLIARELQLTRRLTFFDLETTGTSLETDRIVEIATLAISPDGTIARCSTLLNPGIPIPAGASAVHGIYDADVTNALTFLDIATELAVDLNDSDLAGFNVRRFDLPLLAAEFARANVAFHPENLAVLDMMTIYHLNEPRHLRAAMKFYCDRDHQGHRAEEDVLATVDVFAAQLQRYETLPRDVSALGEYGAPPRVADAATKDGKLAWKDGEVCIAFGRHRGKSLQVMAQQEPDYLRWILGTEFADDTKRFIADALEGQFAQLSQDGLNSKK